MEQELEAGPITPRGFTLLPIGKMVERIHALLKKEGMTEAELPKRREVKRWRNRLERLREIERAHDHQVADGFEKRLRNLRCSEALTIAATLGGAACATLDRQYGS